MSKKSYRLIDYYLRPSKSIERKMVLEAIRGIAKKTQIDYAYIGMGAIAFIDFRMFHKEMVIDDMTSIEAAKLDKDRFEFNKPFKIQMEYDTVSAVLPKIDFKGKDSLVWLDYDGNFNRSIVEDIKSLFSVMMPFSIMLLTCRQDLDPYFEKNNGEIENFDKFKDEFEEYCPINLSKASFENSNHLNLIYETMTNAIAETLSNRNSGLLDSDKVSFKQLFFFDYGDNTSMLTFGGVILNRTQFRSFNSNFKIKKLNFISQDSIPYKIKIPILTKKEIDFLNNHLPEPDLGKFIANTNLHKIPESDRKAYYSIYRYLPDFRETNY